MKHVIRTHSKGLFRSRTNRLILILFIWSASSSVMILTAQNPIPDAYEIDGIGWVPQTWNNCGPATLSMNLDRWNLSVSQGEIATLIRPNPKDGHVSIDQIRYAAAEYGMDSIYIPSADISLVKSFIAADFPVMMPTWHIDSPRNQMGHYRLVHGYDDSTGEFAIRDSLEPEGYQMGYTELDILWRVFNRRMLVVFPPDQSDDAHRLESTIGTENEMLMASLERLQIEREPPEVLPPGMDVNDYHAFAEFNRSMVYNSLDRFQEAADALYKAFDIGLPWRMLWYQPEVLKSVFLMEDYAWIVRYTNTALRPYPYLEELWYWNGRAEEAMGNREAARQSYSRALEIRPGWDEPTGALNRE